MLAKIISAGALTLLLSSGALAYLPQQQHNIYAGHSNGQQQSVNQQYAANTAYPDGTWKWPTGSVGAVPTMCSEQPAICG